MIGGETWSYCGKSFVETRSYSGETGGWKMGCRPGWTGMGFPPAARIIVIILVLITIIISII